MFSKALCFPEKYQFIRSGNRFLISTVINDTAKAMLVKRGSAGMSLQILLLSPRLTAGTRSAECFSA